MHPIFSSAKNLAIVSGLWLLVSSLLVWLLQTQISQYMSIVQALSVLLPWFFVFVFFCISNFYICARFPIDTSRFYYLLLVQLGSLVCAVCLWIACGYVWLAFLHNLDQQDWFSVVEREKVAIAAVAATIYGFFVMAHYIYLVAKQQQLLEREALQEKLLLSQVELQTIKAATHPHFLYNALAMLANIALTHPEKVNGLCLQISDFLRYSVNYANRGFVSINDELSHVQNYLSIERERYGSRLTVEFLVDEEARSLSVIPLVLFPLVENAIKHGIDGLLEGGVIRVEVTLEGDYVRLRVGNDYDPLGVKAKSTHLGLSALKKRLTATYSKNARLNVNRESRNRFVIEMDIPRKRHES